MVSRIAQACLALALALSALGSGAGTGTAAAAAAGSSLTMTSEPGDYIGQGQTWTYGPNNARFAGLIQYGYAVDISIDTNDPGTWWDLWFSSADRSRLVPGTYAAATSDFSLGQPGLWITGTGRACDAGGEFTIAEVAYDAAGKPALLDATFTQRCDGSAAALTGHVRYVAPPVVDPAPSFGVRTAVAGRSGGEIAFDLGAFSDPGGDAAGPWQVRVNWADGTTDAFTTATQGELGRRSHTFPVLAGTYLSNVVVSNARGASTQAPFTFIEAATPYTGSSLVLTGQPGAGVIGKRNLSLGAGATYGLSGSAAFPMFSVSTPDGAERWILEFASPDGQPIQAGFYPNAARAPFHAAGQPGLDVSGNGSGCNQVAGNFDVREAVYAAGALVLFDATFSESCETWMPPFTGEIRFVAPSWSEPILTVADRTYASSDAIDGAFSIDLGSIADASPGAGGLYPLAIDWGDGSAESTSVPLGPLAPRAHRYAKLGTYDVGLDATGPAGNWSQARFHVTLLGVPPQVDAVRYDAGGAPRGGTPVGTSVAFAADFRDPDAGETYSATFAWGDGTTSAGTVTASAAGWTARASHAYTKPGLYTVTVTASDGASSGSGSLQGVVVYSTASTVTGKGSISAPAGACRLSANCANAGTASFNLDGRYFKGAPRTSLSFTAPGFSLSGSQADWLVTASGMATMQGSAAVNGVAGYRCRVTAVDGTPDRLRLEVWAPSGALVYDNGSAASLKSGSIGVR